MKNLIFHIAYTYTLSILVGCLGQGGSDLAGTGSQTGNAIVVGRAMGPDSLPLGVVNLKLRLHNYTPTFKASPDSATPPLNFVDAISNEDGSFEIKDIDSGFYFLEISDGEGNALVEKITITALPDTINLDSIYLQPTGTIKGLIIDSLPATGTQYISIVGLEHTAPIDPDTRKYTLLAIPIGTYELVMINETNVTALTPVEQVLILPNDTTISNVNFSKNYGNWNNIQKIFLNTSSSGANVSGNVHHFPVLLRLTSDNFDFSQALPNGEDIRFTNASDKPLPFQIESWDKQQETANVWVSVDTILGYNAYQYILMFSGQDSALSESNSSAVFDTQTGYAGVWHLNEAPNNNPSNYIDATANTAHAQGVNMNVAPAVSGVIGKGQDMESDLNQYIVVNTDTADLYNFPGPMTVSVWIKIESFSDTIGWQSYVVKGNPSWRLQRANLNNWTEFSLNGSGEYLFGTAPLNQGEWFQLCAVFDGAIGFLYINGVLDGAQTFTGTIAPINSPLAFGENLQSTSNISFDGVMDEVQVLGQARDNNWVKLNYENQKPNANWVHLER